jgi:hypothetical protein
MFNLNLRNKILMLYIKIVYPSITVIFFYPPLYSRVRVMVINATLDSIFHLYSDGQFYMVKETGLHVYGVEKTTDSS